MKYSLLLTSDVMKASQANDRATVEPLLETIAMEFGGTVPDDLPAADADMQDRREDSDLSASALQKISDIVTRQVSLAMNSMNRRAPGPVPVTPTEAATTATASASQAQTVCMPQTQCPPVTSNFVPLSAGGYSLPSTSSTPRTSTLQHHSGQAVFFPPVCHGLPMPTLALPIRGSMGLSLTFGHPTTPSPTPPPPAGLAWLPRARLQPPSSYPLPVRVPTTGPRLRSFVVDAV